MDKITKIKIKINELAEKAFERFCIHYELIKEDKSFFLLEEMIPNLKILKLDKLVLERYPELASMFVEN